MPRKTDGFNAWSGYNLPASGIENYLNNFLQPNSNKKVNKMVYNIKVYSEKLNAAGGYLGELDAWKVDKTEDRLVSLANKLGLKNSTRQNIIMDVEDGKYTLDYAIDELRGNNVYNSTVLKTNIGAYLFENAGEAAKEILIGDRTGQELVTIVKKLKDKNGLTLPADVNTANETLENILKMDVDSLKNEEINKVIEKERKNLAGATQDAINKIINLIKPGIEIRYSKAGDKVKQEKENEARYNYFKIVDSKKTEIKDAVGMFADSIANGNNFTATNEAESAMNKLLELYKN